MKDFEKVKEVEFGVCQANILSDFLMILKKNDYEVLRKNGYEWEYANGFLQTWVDDLVENFCKPIIEHDEDVKIILKEK